MVRRILLSTSAAATLLAVAPAFAADAAPAKEPCSCCTDGSIHDVDHPLRAAQKELGSAERETQLRAAGDGPDVRNQSWGG